MTTSPADAANDINVGDKLMIEGAGNTRMFTVSGLVEFGSSNLHLYDFRSGGPIDQPFEIRAECQGNAMVDPGRDESRHDR